VMEKELGFGEGQLLHKLCKVKLYSLSPYFTMSSVHFFLGNTSKPSLLYRFICTYLARG
jgi:hypothetical protein